MPLIAVLDNHFQPVRDPLCRHGLTLFGLAITEQELSGTCSSSNHFRSSEVGIEATPHAEFSQLRIRILKHSRQLDGLVTVPSSGHLGQKGHVNVGRDTRRTPLERIRSDRVDLRGSTSRGQGQQEGRAQGEMFEINVFERIIWWFLERRENHLKAPRRNNEARFWPQNAQTTSPCLKRRETRQAMALAMDLHHAMT